MTVEDVETTLVTLKPKGTGDTSIVKNKLISTVTKSFNSALSRTLVPKPMKHSIVLVENAVE